MLHILQPFHITLRTDSGFGNVEMYIECMIVCRNDVDFLIAEWFMECILKMEKQPMFHVT